MNRKVCSMCKERKLLEDYNKNSYKKDGLSADCKECCSKYIKDNIENFNPKVLCSCGKYVRRYYIKNHQERKIHSERILNNEE